MSVDDVTWLRERMQAALSASSDDQRRAILACALNDTTPEECDHGSWYGCDHLRRCLVCGHEWMPPVPAGATA